MRARVWNCPHIREANLVPLFLQLLTSGLQPSLIRLPFSHFPRLSPKPSQAPIPAVILFACGPEDVDKDAGQETPLSWHHRFLFLSPISSRYTPWRTLSDHLLAAESEHYTTSLLLRFNIQSCSKLLNNNNIISGRLSEQRPVWPSSKQPKQKCF